MTFELSEEEKNQFDISSPTTEAMKNTIKSIGNPSNNNNNKNGVIFN